ncbi:ubiquitin-protein ligase (E3) [Coniosporium apollinis]|uniref:HECT-type E3 ubiquitin transferase n=1 Tax=Coniosporium apollinis TaxID=61459 RepID=A0ABQ9NI87_9PEZI|nr:ubiquitin-protein ligase (E3) [Coniosporium apollinis]
MFQSFTGTSRRPRQVNLSGRNTNPFAASTGTGAGSQAALASAQQERLQRQRERERLNAAKTIQRVWRGHSSRRRTRDALRAAWDQEEAVASPGSPYTSTEASLLQLERLLRFANVRSAEDVRRIHRYCERQMKSSDAVSSSDGPWPMAYLRLQRLILTAIQKRNTEGLSLLEALCSVTERIPRETARNARPYYQAMAALTSHLSSESSEAERSVLLEATFAPLRVMTADTLTAYQAFACTYLTASSLAGDPAVEVAYLSPRTWLLDALAERLNYKLLDNALSAVVKTQNYAHYPELLDSSNRVRLLACFIYFHRHVHNFKDPGAYSSHPDFVAVVSSLLASVANDFHFEEQNFEEEDNASIVKVPILNGFIQEQIISLVNEESIRGLLSGTRGSIQDQDEDAKQFANYALGLLRFFPSRKIDIQTWLYIGSSSSNQSLSAIKYFWRAARATGVFKTISHNHRDAIALLKSSETPIPAPTASLRWQAPPTEGRRTIATADEWRILLLFMELYTPILRLMDDEEFFSGMGMPGNNKASLSSPSAQGNALPLDDIRDLTIFLKNLGFTLCFNSAEITRNVERDNRSGSLSSHFHVASGAQVSAGPARSETPTPASVAGIAGMGIDYVKGLVTGLLRMLYERDSRRKFLPADHWLMTSEFNMEGFIPDVVEEEERRHKVQEEDDEDRDEDESEEAYDPGTPLIGTRRTQQVRMNERRQRQLRKLSRQKHLQAVAPRLEVLQNMPFFIPFTTRVEIFREFVHIDQMKRRHGFIDPDTWRMSVFHGTGSRDAIDKHHAKIRRGHEFEDAFEQFYPLKEGLKEPIQITFVDQFDTVEAGIDGGGVTKEFLTSVTNQAFNPSSSDDEEIPLFVENDHHLLYPNPSAIDAQKDLLHQLGYRDGSPEYREQLRGLRQRYEFLGRVVGKCLYEGILVDIHFAGFFLLKWALTGGHGSAPKESGYMSNLNDLRDLDEGLYQGLLQLKNYTGNVEDFALNFTITDTVSTDPVTGATKTITRNLIPNGANIPVTNQNRIPYISLVARHRLVTQPAAQTSAFLKGLADMVQPSWLRMFNQSELQTLLAGTSSPLDIADLRRNTLYGGVYVLGDDRTEHPSIRAFWRVMESLSDEERRAVLKFVTSSPRAPLLGFGALNPRFSIRDAGDEQSRLPSTSTCVNLLKLPRYRDEETLREKLLYAVFSGAGFDLS